MTALVVAHRGAWGEARENSLEAFERSIALGCEMFEFDVRRTALGELVIAHDASDVEGHADWRPPRLAEVLALARGRSALDVELKEAGYVEQVLAALEGFPPRALVVTSFIDEVLVEVRRRAPDLRTGLLIRAGARAANIAARARGCGATFIAPHVALARLGVLRRVDRDAFVWTVNRDADLRVLLVNPRVAAVITDVPERALELRAELSNSAPVPRRRG